MYLTSKLKSILLCTILYVANINANVHELSAIDFPVDNPRYATFAKALSLMDLYQVKTIVETGTTRGINLTDIISGDGGSTIIFSSWAYRNGATLYSVDIDPSTFIQAKPFLNKFEDVLVRIYSDSIQFLSEFDKQIDMLYLDSYDFDENNPEESQRHHLNEIITAYPLLSENCIVMIDDCDLPHGGKGKLVIDYLLEKNWKIIMLAKQVIMIREKK